MTFSCMMIHTWWLCFPFAPKIWTNMSQCSRTFGLSTVLQVSWSHIFSMVAIFLNNYSISYSNLVQRDQPSKEAIIRNGCLNCKRNHSSWEFNDHSLWTKMGTSFYILSCISIFILCRSLFEKLSGDNRQGWRWILIIGVPHWYIGHFC